MLSVRWHKVLREVWSHKLRTALVVLSIGVGVFGVGLMATSHFTLLQAMDRAYLATHPAHAELKTDPFDHDLVRAVSRIPGVVDVEGRATVTMRLLDADKEYTLGLAVVADYNHIRINQIQSISGDWPPPPHQLLLERRSLEFLGLRVGDTLLVEDRQGKQRRLAVAGVVYDLNTPIPALTYIISGYISRDTQEWLDGTCQFTQLNLRVAAWNNLDTTWEKTEQAAAIVKRSGRQVYSAGVSSRFGHLLPPDCQIRRIWRGFGNPRRAKWPKRKS